MKLIVNYIEAEIYIKAKDINEEKRIINSADEAKDEIESDDYEYINEEDIKLCKIEINGKEIPFSYFYQFNKKGKYIIKYTFPKLLTNIDSLFYNCDSLRNIDLSHFNTQNVTDMNYMFYGCYSLRNIDFSNCNTQNATNMCGMFLECRSLKNINLSHFNTQNVTNMSCMFCECNSLKNINLSNFNTKNVTNMRCMFVGCKNKY